MIRAYDTFYKDKPSTFILMLALLPTFGSLALMFLVRIYEGRTIDDRRQLNCFSAVALSIASYLMFLMVLENVFILPFLARVFTFIVFLLLLASPLGIAIKAQREESRISRETFSSERNPLMENRKLMASSEASAVKANPLPLASNELPSGEDRVPADLAGIILPDEEGMNILQAICTVDFWLLFIAMVGGMGSAQAVANNLSQIGKSFNYTALEINNLVSLWSIWNLFGRVGAGNLSDYLLHKRGFARPLLMVITLAAMAIGHMVIASGFPGMLSVGSILVGICYGAQWSLMPTITSEVFGVRHLGTIFNAIAIATPVGSYIFSVRVIGYIYDKEAGGEGSCSGPHCFMESFLIMSSVVFLGSLVAIALFFRTSRVYQQVVLGSSKHSLR